MGAQAKWDSVRLVTWRPELRSDFERLNLEWIERYFAVEEEDRRVFADPEGEIVAPGGQVFFLIDEEGVRGTCAVIRHDAESFELAKMAVVAAARGRGYGDRLMEAAIAFARRAGARRMMLLSNTRLAPALALYRKHGFRDVPLDPANGYSRADIQLELALEP
jgi:GNAT superfamily N-acetyltransferase